MEENVAMQVTAPKLPSDEILFGTLSYFTIAVLATIVTKPNSEFCKFHAKQGVVLVGLDLLLLVLISISLAIVQYLAFILFFVGMITMFGLHILGIVNAVQGKMYQLPVVYGLAQKIDVASFLSKNTKPADSITPPTEQAAEVMPTEPVAEPMPASTQPHVTPEPNRNVGHGQDMVDKAVEGLNEENHSL
ncbi:MAG: hypothetical protein Q8P68_02535 [Candidatus Peregrinibacteria bacterium]|nr:hypothetical protein [Candidatus Peregrinibacteria bacterium]MDZ4245119.1 hypothetical protein [Candidatus Gracilibacteria bacterium]